MFVYSWFFTWVCVLYWFLAILEHDDVTDVDDDDDDDTALLHKENERMIHIHKHMYEHKSVWGWVLLCMSVWGWECMFMFLCIGISVPFCICSQRNCMLLHCVLSFKLYSFTISFANVVMLLFCSFVLCLYFLFFFLGAGFFFILPV